MFGARSSAARNCFLESPFLLGLVGKRLPACEAFTPHERNLLATIVHNAGIYDGTLAAGLAWAPPTGESAHDVTRTLLAGAAVAGLFGAVTIESAPTAVYAALGIVGPVII